MKKIILLLMILTACSAPSSQGPHSGTEGLEVSFLRLPDEVYENNEFAMVLEIHNKGATNIENGKVVVVAERGLFEDFDNEINVNLEGKTLYDSIGQKRVETLLPYTKTIFASEKIDTEIRVNTCYQYETLLSTEVCIDPDITGQQTDKPSICPPTRMNYRGGQGAPVAVVSINPIMIPSQNGIIPIFEFEIENLGDGRVVRSDVYNTPCSSEGLKPQDIGIIDASEVYLGLDQLDCTRNVLKIQEVQRGNEFYDADRTVMRCEGEEITEKQAYIGSLTLKLSYGYTETISENMFVLKSPTSIN